MPKEPNPERAEDEVDVPGETWQDDQTARKYYYDDAHGYQEYEPDKEPDEDDDENDL